MAALPKLPGIPSISPVKDQIVAAILRPMKESLEIISATLTGDPLANASTITDGVSTNGYTAGAGTGAGTGAYDPTTDYTPPSRPTGFSVSGAFVYVTMTWDAPSYANHAYTEVWRSSTNVLGAASLIGFCPGSVYSDAVGNSSNYYYWIRFVSQANVAGPYNATSGTLGATATDPAYLLGLLNNQITSSELATALNSRINLIDGPATTAGTVNNRLSTLQSQVNDLLAIPAYNATTSYTVGQQATFDGGLYQVIVATVGHAPTNTTYWKKIGDYTSLGDAVAANTVNIGTLSTGLGTEVDARSLLASQMRGDYTGTDLASISSGLLYDEKYARTTSDSALATSISTLSTTVSGHTTSISTNTSSINGIRGRYTVQIDNNGQLSGFGLSSDLLDSGTATSKFLISVNQFAVIAPGVTAGTPGSVPFAVLTTAQTINGVAFNAGVYIDGGSIVDATITNAKIKDLAVDSAKIADATITTAKIGDLQITSAKIADATITTAKIGDAQITSAKISALDAAKITTGTLNAARIAANSITASKIVSNGLSIKATDGTVILSAGATLATSSFSGDVTGKISGTAASTVVTTANDAKTAADSAATAAANAQTAADLKLAKSGAQILTGPVTLNAASALTVGSPALDSVAGHNGFYIGSTGIVGTKDGKATFTLDNGGNATFSGSLSAASGTFDGTLTANVTTYAGGGSWNLGFAATNTNTYVVSGGMVTDSTYTIPVTSGKKYVINASNPKLLYYLEYGILTNSQNDIGDAVWTLTMTVDGFVEGTRRLCFVQVPTSTVFNLYYLYSASPPYYTNAELLGGTRGYDLPESSITHAFCRGTAAGSTLTVRWYLTHNTPGTVNTKYNQWIGEKIMYVNTNDSQTWKLPAYRGTAGSGFDSLGINVAVFSTQYA